MIDIHRNLRGSTEVPIPVITCNGIMTAIVDRWPWPQDRSKYRPKMHW